MKPVRKVTLLEVAEAGDSLSGAFLTRVEERVQTLGPVDRCESARWVGVGWHKREKFLLHNLNSSFVTETPKNVMYRVQHVHRDTLGRIAIFFIFHLLMITDLQKIMSVIVILISFITMHTLMNNVNSYLYSFFPPMLCLFWLYL